MKKILVVQNVARERLGLLENPLVQNGISRDVADLDAGDPFPDPLEYDALIVFGAPDSANDGTAKMIDEVGKVGRAVRAGMPYLGICLGMQVLVKACGGRVFPNDIKEIGWRGPDGEFFTVALTEDGQCDPLFAGLESPFVTLQLHGETVELTEDMILLGTGKYCRNQIVRVGEKAYGIQCHFEQTPQMFGEWLAEDDDLKRADHAAMQRDYQSIKQEYERVGNALFGNFMRVAGLVAG